ncbi:MAG: hypothetical protein U5L04_08915 [Trueperaceae bacterium]|nr:hypothetical protein [Trueperaceae bacterium]
MPNRVYTHAHEGLATMVSARAATRVLQDTLRDRGTTPDTVSAEQMHDLLLGPVLKEFEQILPREGLKRNLGSLAKELEALETGSPGRSDQAENNPSRLESIRNFLNTPIIGERPAAESAPARPDASSENAGPEDTSGGSATRISRSAQRRPEPSPKDTLEIPPGDISPPTRTPVPSATPVPPSKARPQRPTRGAAQRKAAPLSEERLEQIVLRFAQIEHVRIVAAIRDNGEIAVSRGSGIDIDALSRYGLMGLRLLGRSGELNSYYLAHTKGQLFLFTFGRDTLILVGRSELNVGTVFATAAALKEEQ